jgi:hypothetical protein
MAFSLRPSREGKENEGGPVGASVPQRASTIFARGWSIKKASLSPSGKTEKQDRLRLANPGLKRLSISLNDLEFVACTIDAKAIDAATRLELHEAVKKVKTLC